MKLVSLFSISMLLSLGSCHSQKVQRDVIYQVATLEALMEGQYDGLTPYARLQRRGDFGLGTFHQLDGEMVAVAGQFYQIRSDGLAYPVKGTTKTPFADVTFFDAEESAQLMGAHSYQQLSDYLLEKLIDEDRYYALKIEGTFQYLKTRSVPKQVKPYPTLPEVIAEQLVFTYEALEGTMVGFYMPATAQDISTTGFHFHFISQDRTKGGHVLDCIIDEVVIELDASDGLKRLKQGRKGGNLTK